MKPFFSELKKEGVKVEGLWSEIKDLVVKTLCSIQPILKHTSFLSSEDPFNQGYYEILGFDVMMDSQLKPYLLEVNHNPSLNISSEADLHVKRNLVYDVLGMLRLTKEMRARLKNIKRK